MVSETLRTWVSKTDGRYLDVTIGGGGHATALLEQFPDATLIGLDRDPEALEASRKRLAPYSHRVQLVQGDFADLGSVLEADSGPPVVGILGDLGVSSHQIDDPNRGFSYLTDGPLRLVLDKESPYDATEWIATASERDLKRVFMELGELRGSGRLARLIAKTRRESPIETTFQLVDVLRRAGMGAPRQLSQAFQAIRLEVNHEMDSLRQGIAAARDVLPEGGTLTLISFESLMDRVVKQAFRPPRLERPHPGISDPLPDWEVLTRKVVRPTPEEVARNPRSRSARLRAARRVRHGA